MKQPPKILVSSISGWNLTTGSDTLPNLLSGYYSNRIANIFMRSDIPDSDVCDHYFRISETAVLKSVINHSIKTGFLCERKGQPDNVEQKEEQKRYHFFSRHRWTLLLILREILWKCGKWNSIELNQFVNDFDPEVLFFPIESYLYFNRLNSYLIRKTHKKAIGFLWDDNFTYKTCNGPLQYVLRFFTRRSVRRLVEQCDKVLTIDPKMKKECDAFFGIDSILMTKGIDFEKYQKPVAYQPHYPLQLLYTGKMNIGRDKTLAVLAKQISIFNKTKEYFHLNIYTTTCLSNRQKHYFEQSSTTLCGAVPQTELPDIQTKADILVFAEAMTGPNSQIARLSFSTKLTDYFAVGKAILAIGRNDIAPMEYLKENKAALCASCKKDLNLLLTSLINEPRQISHLAAKAFTLGYEKHNIHQIRNTLWEMFYFTAEKR